MKTTQCPRCEEITDPKHVRLCRECAPTVRREMEQSRRYHEIELAHHFGQASPTRRFPRSEKGAAA